MGMPSTGCIAIKNNAIQTCSSICAATLGSTGSLVNASIIAGKTAPHCLREFYSFCRETSWKCVDMCTISCNGGDGGQNACRVDCIHSIQAMTPGQCYTVRICGCLQASSQYGPVACSVGICNSVRIYDYYVYATTTPTSFSRDVIIRYGDTFCTCIQAANPMPGMGQTCVCLSKCTVTATCGLFCSTGVQTVTVYSQN